MQSYYLSAGWIHWSDPSSRLINYYILWFSVGDCAISEQFSKRAHIRATLLCIHLFGSLYTAHRSIRDILFDVMNATNRLFRQRMQVTWHLNPQLNLFSQVLLSKNTAKHQPAENTWCYQRNSNGYSHVFGTSNPTRLVRILYDQCSSASRQDVNNIPTDTTMFLWSWLVCKIILRPKRKWKNLRWRPLNFKHTYRLQSFSTGSSLLISSDRVVPGLWDMDFRGIPTVTHLFNPVPTILPWR